MVQLRQEVRERRKKTKGKDVFSLVQEELKHNPFMSRILKSTDFTPVSGVKHTDNILLPNSPSVSGGDFKSPRPGIMSRAEFEMRQSLTILQDMGPESSRKKRNNRVT